MAGRALRIDPKKETTSGPGVHQGRTEPIKETEIAARAYECWQERGCPIGSAQEDWFRAEQELKDQRTEGRVQHKQNVIHDEIRANTPINRR